MNVYAFPEMPLYIYAMQSPAAYFTVFYMK